MPDRDRDGDGRQERANNVVIGAAFNLSEKQKLTGSMNYQNWSFLMKGALVTEGLWKVVQGAEEDNDKNDRAFYKIALNVSPNLHPALYNISRAKDA
jgi:hypothetical protein